MNTKLLMQAISGVIPGGISTKDFAAIISTDKNTAEKILEHANSKWNWSNYWKLGKL